MCAFMLGVLFFVFFFLGGGVCFCLVWVCVFCSVLFFIDSVN